VDPSDPATSPAWPESPRDSPQSNVLVERGGYVAPGQLVECEIEDIGFLSNRYVLG
jgi:hypothetical protein